MQIPREKEANQSSASPLPGVALAGPGSPKPLSRLVRTATRVGQLGPRWSARAPRGRASRWSRPPSLPPWAPALRPTAESGLGSAASARGPPPLPGARHPARGGRPRRSPSSRGGLRRPASSPSGRKPAAHVQGGRREEEEAREGRREGGRREKGSCLDPVLPRACQERALSGSPVPASQPRPAPRTSSSSSSSRGTPRPLPPAAPTLGQRPPPAPTRPHPQLSGLRPGTRALAPSFLASFLPSRPPSRSRSPSRVPIVSVPVSVRRARLALPRLSPSHFLSRPPPPSRRGSPRPSRRCPGSSPRSPRRPPEGPGARGGNSGRARLAQPRAPALPGEEGPGR